MNYYFQPLDEQVDYGFGVIANSYYLSAQTLMKKKNFKRNWYSHYPVNFILRHSVELYLKAIIILFHKKYRIDFDDDNYDAEPKIKLNNGKWRLMRTTHRLDELYYYFEELVSSLDIELQKTDVSWEMPKKVKEAINFISGYDNASDFFRYPISKDENKDRKKDIFQECDIIDESLVGDFINYSGQMLVIVEDNNGRKSKAYVNDNKDVFIDKLIYLSENFDAFHSAVRDVMFGGF